MTSARAITTMDGTFPNPASQSNMTSLQPAINVRAVPATLVAVMGPPRRAPWWRNTGKFALLALLWLGLGLALAPASPSAGAYLAAAARARAGLRYDRALDLDTRASAADPSDPRPLCDAGDVRMLQREWQFAADAYRACAALDPSRASAWLGLGDALDALHDGGVLAAWERSAAVGGRDALRRIALRDEVESQFDAARTTWQRLPASDPQALVHLGLLALHDGNLATARRDFLAARATTNPYTGLLESNGFLPLAARPSLDAEGWTRLGLDFLAAGMPRLAADPLRTATMLDPTHGAAHAALGWTLWLLGQPEPAHAEVAASLRLNPGLSFAWFVDSILAEADHLPGRAETDIQHALALDSANPTLWSAEARLALARRDYVGADVAFGNAADDATRPDETIAHLQFLLDHGIGLTDGHALAVATAAQRRWPYAEPVIAVAARLQDAAGHYDVAYYTAQAALALDPTDPSPRLMLARTALNDGDFSAAALNLRIALALRPHGPFAGEAAALLQQVAAVNV